MKARLAPRHPVEVRSKLRRAASRGLAALFRLVRAGLIHAPSMVPRLESAQHRLMRLGARGLGQYPRGESNNVVREAVSGGVWAVCAGMTAVALLAARVMGLGDRAERIASALASCSE
jgi:hypothetical protein